jgi:hypothetical protein
VPGKCFCDPPALGIIPQLALPSAGPFSRGFLEQVSGLLVFLVSQPGVKTTLLKILSASLLALSISTVRCSK